MGDSASILRAGAGGEIVEKSGAEPTSTPGGSGSNSVKKRDFARVLEIYQEVVVAEEKAKWSSSSGKKTTTASILLETQGQERADWQQLFVRG